MEMSFVKDMLSMFNKKELSFLKSYKETEDFYTFLFEKEKDITWNAGQYGLFTITHKKIKNNTRPFSVASVPQENTIQITTKISDQPSEFKKAMLELTKGTKITMAGPVGAFYLKEEHPTVLIAGGIGITPFRSIVKQLEAEKKERPVHLLYLDSNKTYIFKDELDRIASNTSIGLTYLDSSNHLQQALDKSISTYKNNAKYYIAGPKSMVEDTSTYLRDNEISKRNIKKDVLIGY